MGLRKGTCSTPVPSSRVLVTVAAMARAMSGSARRVPRPRESKVHALSKPAASMPRAASDSPEGPNGVVPPGPAGREIPNLVMSSARDHSTMAAMRSRPDRILAWMCVLIAVNQLGFGGIVPVLALYSRSFGVSQSAIGVAIAVYGLARFLVAMPAGRLADGLGRRPAIALGGLVTAAGNLLCGYAPSFSLLVAGRFVAGGGAALVLISGQIVLAAITTPARRGRTMAVYQGVFLFAVSIGPLPGGLLAEHYGLRAPFLAYAVAGVLAAALAWVFIPETKSRRDLGVSEAAPASFVAQVRILTGHTGFMLVSLVSFMNAVARTGGLFNVIPVLAHDRLGLNADRIGLGLALASLVGLVVIYTSGVLVER